MRTTRRHIDLAFVEAIRFLPVITGHRWAIDHYSPGGNPYTYTLVLIAEKGGAEHDPLGRRFTADGFYALLKGIVLPHETQERYECLNRKVKK